MTTANTVPTTIEAEQAWLDAQRAASRAAPTLPSLPEGEESKPVSSADRRAFVRDVTARLMVARAVRGAELDALALGASIEIAEAIREDTGGE